MGTSRNFLRRIVSATAGLMTAMIAVLLLAATPALAATNNFYSGTQLSGSESAGGFFYPDAVALDGSGDVFVGDAEHGVVDELEPGGKLLRELKAHGGEIHTEGVAVDASGDVFVGDYENSVVYEFEPDGALLREITGGKTSAKAFFPTGVAVGPGGELYVADYEDGVVDEFEPAAYEASPTGAPVHEYHVSEADYVAVDPTSGDVYVAGASATAVKEFEPDGTLAGEITRSSVTPEPSSFAPRAIAVAPNGEVYVADTANDVVDRFNSSRSYLSQFNGAETSATTFSYISALAVNASGEVYVGDGSNHVIDIYSKPEAEPAPNNFYSGTQLSGSESAGGFFYPDAVALDGSGDVFVGDAEHGVVDELEPGGKLLRELKAHGGEIHTEGVAVDASGDVFVGDYENSVVYEFEPDGALLREITGGKTSAKAFFPTGVAVGPGGELYVADYEDGVVDEFEPAAYEASPTGAPVHEYHVSEADYVAVDPTSGDVYVAGASATAVKEFEPDGTLAGEITRSSVTPEPSSFAPRAIAVAPNGEVYVADTANDVVDRFNSSRSYLSQFNGAETSATTFSYISALAVNASGEVYVGDGSNHVIDIYSKPKVKNHKGSSESQWVTEAATSVTATTATLNGTVNPEGGEVTTCEFEYGTSTSYGEKASCDQTSSQIGVGTSPVTVSVEVTVLEPDTKYYFRVAGEGGKGKGGGSGETFTTHFKPPTAVITPVTGINGHCATFDGEVNPEGAATTYQFEDSTNGTTWTAVGQASAGEGTSAVPVSQHVCGLSGSTTYHVRLFAENSGGHVTSSGEETFPTPASAPQLAGVGASVLGYGEATLYATIYPEKQATTYRFEYGTTTAYGTIVPAGEGDAGTTPTQVSQTIMGLAPGTVYHFRVVAINGTGTSHGTDKTFVTSLIASEGQPVAPGLCPNETLREESNVDPATGVPYSVQLPDCRAYEQVTPQFKDGARVEVNPSSLGGSGLDAISTGGSPLVASSTALWGTPAGTEVAGFSAGTFYELTRSDAAWSAASLTPPTAQFPFASPSVFTAADTDVGIWVAGIPSQPLEAVNLYRREGNGVFVETGPLAPPSATTGPPRGFNVAKATQVAPVQVEASADLSDVVFTRQSRPLPGFVSYLWPGDATVSGNLPSLYEYVGTGHTGVGSDVPALVGVNNSGTQISQCGTALGAYTAVAHGGDERHAVSSAGSTVFFNAQAGGCTSGATGPAVNQLYARIGIPKSAQVTVNVAAASQAECETSTSCDVTSPVTYDGASSDGSMVFFTAAQAGLVPGDTDATNALYECALPGDGGGTPGPTGVVNACPDLHAISVTGTSEGAEVQSGLDVSEEGSHVYFTAKGVLTSEPDRSLPAGHQVAEPGKNNLYVWEAVGDGQPAGRISFIATLPSGSPNQSQATPDGDYLVFTTTGDLTSDDTSSAAQAFRYDALTGELIRISVGENGFNDDGNSDSLPATLAPSYEPEGLNRGITISDDGAYVVFQSSDALTPEVRGGVNNVYEWHDGNVSLISDGVDAYPNAGAIGLIGMDPSGSDIFFTTDDRLVGQDIDEAVDVYDARIDGGFPAPKVASCKGEECQGALTSPFAPPTPGSTGAPAIGNLTPGSTSLPPPTKAKPKPLTRAQKLAKALKLCRKEKSKGKRERCEKGAKAKYGSKTKTKKKKSKKKK